MSLLLLLLLLLLPRLPPPLRAATAEQLSLEPSSLLSLAPAAPALFGIRLFHGGFPFASLSSSFFLPPFHPNPTLIRCAQASRSFLLSPPRATLCVPHSCGIAPGWPTFYNPVQVSWGGADLRVGVHLLSASLRTRSLCYLGICGCRFDQSRLSGSLCTNFYFSE